MCLTIGKCDKGYAVLDMWRRKIEFPELVRIAVALSDQWIPDMVLIEDAASGQSLTQMLQRDTRLPLKGIKPQGDKVVRAQSVTGLVESGRVWLPDRADWLATFLDECASFPTGKHDDIVDALTYGLQYLRRNDPGEITSPYELTRASRWSA